MTDFIVVGGGSAGCALAARLSEEQRSTVLLLEAGARDWNPYIHLPVGYYKTTKGALTWGYKLAPQRHQNDITPEFTQARVLGGGSSINAQVYTRGTPADYDGWASSGCTGWSYREVLPYFKRSERNERLSEPYHGTEGPLRVSDQRHTHSLSKAFVRACQEFGIPYNDDFSGAGQAGAGLYQVTNYNGRRCSTAVGYLRVARKRPNLKVITNARALRILIERGRAVGVEYAVDGRIKIARAEHEIILAAGAIGSPWLLLLSGIGPPAHLNSVGIKPLVELPGVGRNLHDHLDVFMMYNVKGVHSYDIYKQVRRQVWAFLQYAAFRNGPLSANVVEGGAFWATDRTTAQEPDIQFHFLAGTGVEAVTNDQSTGNGCTLNVYILRPKARGSVELKSSDPRVAPLIDPNFLGDPSDMDRTLEAIHVGQEIMRQRSIAKFIEGEFMPGPSVRTRSEYEAYVRDSARSGYHPVGTCRMGQDELAVVDPELKVRGIDGLRIADASVMPRLVSGNTNAPSIMIAERASDHILRKRLGNDDPDVAALSEAGPSPVRKSQP